MAALNNTDAMSAEEKSNALRAEGNALYKSMKLMPAIEKYEEAAKLTPKSPLPLRNSSAAFFETGRYTSCKRVAEKAIKLEENCGADDRDVQVRKLKARIEKAEKFMNPTDEIDAQEVRGTILKRLGKYKASLLADYVYFHIGHDTVLSIFDESIQIIRDLRHLFKEECVSFFFGGIGDARNLLYTMIHITEMEQSSKTPESKYHFLVNDHNISVLARDLIILVLIQELSNVDSGTYVATQILCTIFFVYNATIMPRYAFTHLQRVIKQLIEILSQEEQPLSWFYIYECDRPKFISAFQSWSGNTIAHIKTSDIIRKVAVRKMMSRLSLPSSSECRGEQMLYKACALLFPPDSIHDPDFANLLASGQDTEKYKKYLEDHWDFNVTLVESSLGVMALKTLDLGHDPFQMIHSLDYSNPDEPKPERKFLYDYVAPFFVKVSKALNHLQGRFQIEVILGDCTDVGERIRYGMMSEKTEHASSDENGIIYTESETSRPKNFPSQFDRIHLSNVPDYIGGHLSTFLYMTPILKKLPSSYITANCLRNSASFDSIEDYLSEYQLITSEKMLDQLCQIRIIDRGEGNIWPMACFTYYSITIPKPHQFDGLLPRESLTKWFYALFFKLVLPMPNDLWDRNAIIFAPLNLTVIPRLVSQLVQIGYPAHWLSGCLQNTITNNVITTGRPPRKIPLKPADVNKNYALRKLDTSPFVPELSMVLATFAPLLPFSLTSSPLTLPSLQSIYRYSFHLPSYDEVAQFGTDERNNCIALLFWDETLFRNTKAVEKYLKCMRPLLDPAWDEVDSSFRDPAAVKVRAEGLFLYTTIEWNIPRRIASAWMENVFVDRMGQQWTVSLVKTDTWVPILSTVTAVMDSVSCGEAWSQETSGLVDAVGKWGLE